MAAAAVNGIRTYILRHMCITDLPSVSRDGWRQGPPEGAETGGSGPMDDPRHRAPVGFSEPVEEVLGRQGPAQVEPLHRIASPGPQARQHRLVVDAVGDGLEAEMMRQL